MSAFVAAIGRILIALLFIVSGANKLMAPGVAAAGFAQAGMSDALVVPVAVFELVAGICLAIGIVTGLAATALAVFTALTILMVHNQFTDPTQVPVILSHVALIGGLLMVIAHKLSLWQYDRMRLSRERDRAKLDAEATRHDAELRAARAENRADLAERSNVQPVETTRVVTAPAPDGTPVPVDVGYVDPRPRKWYQVW
ncbi:DoxX family protein [Novosphingobium sp. MW5]|nr:DoxX family protein [Novosphingobium sp. MW5]